MLSIASGCSKDNSGGSSGSSKKSLSESKITLPEYYGFYAVDNGRTVRFDKGESDQEFSPKVEFIVFDKAVAFGVDEKSVIRIAFDEKEDDWVRYVFPSRNKPVEGKSEMVRIVPDRDLVPGLYELKGGGRFSVQKNLYKQKYVDDAMRALNEKRWNDANNSAIVALRISPSDGNMQQLVSSLPIKIVDEADQGLKEDKWEYALSQLQLIPSSKQLPAVACGSCTTNRRSRCCLWFDVCKIDEGLGQCLTQVAIAVQPS